MKIGIASERDLYCFLKLGFDKSLNDISIEVFFCLVKLHFADTSVKERVYELLCDSSFIFFVEKDSATKICEHNERK